MSLQNVVGMAITHYRVIPAEAVNSNGVIFMHQILESLVDRVNRERASLK